MFSEHGKRYCSKTFDRRVGVVLFKCWDSPEIIKEGVHVWVCDGVVTERVSVNLSC